MPNIPRVGGTTVSFSPWHTAEGQQFLEKVFAELAAGDDDPVEVLGEPVQLIAQQPGVLELQRDLGVDVGEEIELSDKRCGQRSVPDDEDPLARSDSAPQSPRRCAENEREHDRRTPDEEPVLRAEA